MHIVVVFLVGNQLPNNEDSSSALPIIPCPFLTEPCCSSSGSVNPLKLGLLPIKLDQLDYVDYTSSLEFLCAISNRNSLKIVDAKDN